VWFSMLNESLLFDSLLSAVYLYLGLYNMTKKILAIPLFAACLVSTALTANVASAKDSDVYFYPKGKWNIERAGKHTEGAPIICAVSNKFNNGYVVQIVGSSEGVLNLNIDFRQDSFQSNTSYDVTYSVPGITKRVIPAKAFKKNLLVSDLRGEDDFATALQKASVLDVEIKGVEFRMYMTGLVGAMDEYAKCIEPQQIIDTPVSQIIEEVASIQKTTGTPIKINFVPDGNIAPPPPQLNEPVELNNVMQSNDMAKHKLRPSASNKPRYTEELAKQLKEQSDQYKPEITDNAAQEEVVEIVEFEELKEVTQESIIEIIGDNLEGDMAQKEEFIGKEASASDISVEPKQITKITSAKSSPPVYTITKLKSVSVDLTTENAAHIGAASVGDMDDKAMDLAAISPAIGKDNGEFINMRNKLSELEGRVGVLLGENKMLNEELKIILQDSENEKMSVSSNNWDLERATMKFNEAERQVMRLGRKLQTQKAQCKNEKAELENMLFDPELTNQNQLASLASLETELDSVKSDLYRQQRQYEERIKLLEKRLDTP